ncbi:MAG: TetR/AcrR family transcriptional regulator [Sphingomonadales bacterium]
MTEIVAMKWDAATAPARVRILDAAEWLFSLRGYHGVTIREITSAAGTDVSAANYYFQSKENLFATVVMRRADEHSRNIAASLDRLEAACGDSPPGVEAVIRAFVQPVIDKLARGGKGWRNYIHLLASMTNSQQNEAYVAVMNTVYDSVMRRVVGMFGNALPQATPTSLYRSFHLMVGALTHVYAETGGIERLSEGAVRSSDVDVMLDHLVPFLAAGLERMSQQGAGASGS